MKPLFCNNCHKRIHPPAFIKDNKASIKGKIKLNCSDKNCKGSATIKPVAIC